MNDHMGKWMLDAWRGMRYTAKVCINEYGQCGMTWIKVYYYPVCVVNMLLICLLFLYTGLFDYKNKGIYSLWAAVDDSRIPSQGLSVLWVKLIHVVIEECNPFSWLCSQDFLRSCGARFQVLPSLLRWGKVKYSVCAAGVASSVRVHT